MRTYIIASILVILGIGAIAWKGTLPVSPTPDWRIPYLSELSSALMVSGLLSVLYRLFQDSETESNMRRLLRIHDSVDDLGLVEIVSDKRRPDDTALVRDADYLSIVLNDGLRWVGNNAVALQTRMSTKGRITELFLADPDGAFIAVLAAKTGMSPDDLSRKVRDSWKRIQEIWNSSSKKGIFTVYKLKNYPTRSIFLTEDRLIEAPYQISSGRTDVPSFEYRKVARSDSPYAFAQRDIEALKTESSVEFVLKPEA